MRLIWILALAILAWRLLAGAWPWQSLRRWQGRETLDQARKLLEVRPGASKQEIVEAHRRRLAVVHPDRGGSNEAVHQANAARDVLLAEMARHTQE